MRLSIKEDFEVQKDSLMRRVLFGLYSEQLESVWLVQSSLDAKTTSELKFKPTDFFDESPKYIRVAVEELEKSDYLWTRECFVCPKCKKLINRHFEYECSRCSELVTIDAEVYDGKFKCSQGHTTGFSEPRCYCHHENRFIPITEEMTKRKFIFFNLKKESKERQIRGIWFEELIAGILKELGYTTETNTIQKGQSGAHHEIDIIARYPTKGMSPLSNAVVECKAWQGEVHKDQVLGFFAKSSDLGEQLKGRMLFITTGQVDPQAKLFAKYYRIQIIEWNEKDHSDEDLDALRKSLETELRK